MYHRGSSPLTKVNNSHFAASDEKVHSKMDNANARGWFWQVFREFIS